MPNGAFKIMNNSSLTEFIRKWKHESAQLCSLLFSAQRPHVENLTEQMIKRDTIQLFRLIENQKEHEVLDYLLLCSKGKIKSVSLCFYNTFSMTIYDHAILKNFKLHSITFINLLGDL
ncbi:hypothetical protein HZS_5756 [Henneguya salminicola]|nr:hypothetical protein HZS_5756 [Henneguya salminicola]